MIDIKVLSPNERIGNNYYIGIGNDVFFLKENEAIELAMKIDEAIDENTRKHFKGENK
jgi:hypothetical protein